MHPEINSNSQDQDLTPSSSPSLSALLGPERLIANPSWRKLWDARERGAFQLVSRVYFSFFALVYAAHYYLVDLPLKKENPAFWFWFRFGMMVANCCGLALTFVSRLKMSKYYKLPLALVGLAAVFMQGQSMNQRIQVSFSYSIILGVLATLALRTGIFNSLLYLLLSYATCSYAWYLREAEWPYITSAAVVGLAAVAVLRARMVGDIQTFLADQRTFDLQRQLLEAGRRHEIVASMSQMLAHDVRRPFTTLRMAINLIRGAKDNPPRQQQLITRLESMLPPMITQVEGLIVDVMEMGSNTPPRPEPITFKELVSRTVAEVYADAIPDNMSIRALGNDQTLLLVEPRKILRALVNIAQNAKEAMGRKGGVITFEIEPSRSDPSFAVLTITNTNSHIRAEDLPKVFQSFYTAKADGTGLGLAIASKVVEAHGGSISVSSDEVNGVSFHMVLPSSSKHK